MSVAELEIANPNPGTLREVSVILSRQPANVQDVHSSVLLAYIKTIPRHPSET